MTSNELNAALNLRFCAWAHWQRRQCPLPDVAAATDHLWRQSLRGLEAGAVPADEASQDCAAINAAMMVVPDRERRVIVAFYLVAQGTTAKRAAADLGIPRATFYRELARARRRVAALADQIALSRASAAETHSQNLGKVSMDEQACTTQH